VADAGIRAHRRRLGIATLGLGFYFAHFAGYAGGAYGALGGVLAFLFWLALMALILLLGAELNSVLLRRAAIPAATAPSDDQREIASIPAQSVPRGTYTPPSAPSRTHGHLRRAFASILVAVILTTTRTLLKVRPYATRLTKASRR
jgi:hypothetical protein